MANKRTTEDTLRTAYQILAGIPAERYTPRSRAADTLRSAYQILAGIPAERFTPRLGTWYRAPFSAYIDSPYPGAPDPGSCGTLACGAGWLSLHPDFKRGISEDWDEWCRRRFGSHWKLARLFGERDHPATHEYTLPLDQTRAMTDKQILLYRIRRELGQTEQQAYDGAMADGS